MISLRKNSSFANIRKFSICNGAYLLWNLCTVWCTVCTLYSTLFSTLYACNLIKVAKRCLKNGRH